MTKKIYLAHPISTTADFNDSIRVANELRNLGYQVYAAVENNSINDKSNNPTPIDIYNGDVGEILKSNIFVVNLTGGQQDGTISEIGLVAGLNESGQYNIPIIAYTSNKRLSQPQFYKGVPSASSNHLVLGMVAKHGYFVGDEDGLMDYLKREVWQ
ncbi:nucleoside 2-deoxyribosyltransferase [Staphylococcus massiliensis]|uniref:Nucleoside 2-deoxyribosyltransferase n=1 Tax=Staphylococcus massiliensis S46 TaxID=1229783 RepID=K9ASQ1_9STAP|nr:nucleoside 2-deoxyribosyltransferase [Staphylococcus massiliensis]EKU50334.1 hypothetical protein C273_01790 [Staphylococcus massiliensis S46]